MNWIPVIMLIVVAWLAVFAPTQFAPVRAWFETPLGVLPALTVYAALNHRLWVASLFSVLVALGQDALSSHKIGVSLLPYFLATWLLYQRRHVILRDQPFAQFCLAAVASAGISLLTWLILTLSGKEPIHGWGTLWQIFIGAVFNGWVCPLCFALFGSLRRAFEYQELGEQPFPSNREIKRGRT